MAGVRRGAFTCVGWHVTLCDPVWQVTSRSSEMGFPWRAISAFTVVYLYWLCWLVKPRVSLYWWWIETRGLTLVLFHPSLYRYHSVWLLRSVQAVVTSLRPFECQHLSLAYLGCGGWVSARVVSDECWSCITNRQVGDTGVCWNVSGRNKALTTLFLCSWTWTWRFLTTRMMLRWITAVNVVSIFSMIMLNNLGMRCDIICSRVVSYISRRFLADRTACSMIRYWHDTVVCLSVRLSVTL